MTGKDKNNLFDAYSAINKKTQEVVNEDVASNLDTEDAAFDQAGGESSEPETFGDSGPNAVDDVEEIKEEENENNSEKNSKDSINNSNIMSKSTFDKLYEDVMGDENLALSQEMELGGDDDMFGGDDLGGDDLGDEGGDVTVTLTSDQVDVLRDILGQVDGDGDGEDVGDEDLGELGDEDAMDLEDSVQAEMQVHAEPKAVGNANHLSSVSSGSNKASGNVRTTHGNAKHGTVREDPVPSELGGGDRSHKDAGNTGSGSNKPNNPGTPGVGNSLFGN
ncbi:hypothetical protein H8E06_00695 [bacterium]|nr:hypothetical protein [bacterium]